MIKKYFRKDKINLSVQQKEAFEMVQTFSHHNNNDDLDKNVDELENILIVTGEAGSGKTELIKYIVDNITGFEDIYVSALSGRAAAVLRAKGVTDAKTMASLLYGRPTLQWERRSLNREKKTKSRLEGSKNSLYIFDESSMIPDYYDERGNWSQKDKESELETIEKFILKNNYTIFIGDIYQLGPPINIRPFKYQNSSALNPYYFEDKGLKVKSINLDLTFRQEKNSQLLYLARGLISENKFIKPYLDKSVQRLNNESECVDKFVECFSEDTNSIKILSFKNEDVNRWNTEIRNKLHSLNLQVSGQTEYEINQLEIKNKLNEMVKLDEILMITKNNRFYTSELLNGDNVKVTKIYQRIIEGPKLDLKIDFWDGNNKETKVLKNVQLHFQDVQLLKVDANAYESEFIDARIIIETLDTQKLTNSLHRSQRENIIDSYLREDVSIRKKEQIDAIVGDASIYDKEEKLAQIYESDIFMNSLWISYGYAITTHKAQGGEWENIIVDFANSYSNSINWAYTSITRASKSVFLYEYPEKEDASKPLNYKNPILRIFESLNNLITESNTLNRSQEREPSTSELENEIASLKKQLEDLKSQSKRSSKKGKQYNGQVDENGYINDSLVEKLKSYRTELARTEGNSPFIIFNNKTLNSIVYFLPKDLNELSQITGMTERRIERYGDGIIKIINNQKELK
tara:strand:- start:559 stop:2625 length:2067 start_codon:yes stop_codon:yes gene_type:complete